MASTILFPNIESLYRGKKVTGREKVPVKSIDGEGKVVGLYFSAFWCPPCRDFTPKLIQWYKKLVGKLGPNKFEIVYITCDRNSENFDEHFDSMPWLTLSYSEGALQASLINVLTCHVRIHTLFYCIIFPQKKLSDRFQVTGIPTLVMVDAANGRLITKAGRLLVNDDPLGSSFPWKKPEDTKMA